MAGCKKIMNQFYLKRAKQFSGGIIYKCLIGCCTLLFCGIISAQVAPTNSGRDLILWNAKPATNWLDAMPMGNGRLGAMVFGGIAEERLALNEDTLYANEPDGQDL